MTINKTVEQMINLGATLIEITPILYNELNDEILELIKTRNVKIEVTDKTRAVCMYKQKVDCYAYVKNDKYSGCFCLKELYCRNENCRFYQERLKAKKKYLDAYNVNTASLIAKNIDKYFRNL